MAGERGRQRQPGTSWVSSRKVLSGRTKRPLNKRTVLATHQFNALREILVNDRVIQDQIAVVQPVPPGLARSPRPTVE